MQFGNAFGAQDRHPRRGHIAALRQDHIFHDDQYQGNETHQHEFVFDLGQRGTWAKFAVVDQIMIQFVDAVFHDDRQDEKGQ